MQSTLLMVYALLITIGGVIGFFVANSQASLLSAGLLGISLFICSFYMQSRQVVYYLTTALVFAIGLFFAYRYTHSHQMMPAGMMTLLSIALGVYLIISKKRTYSPHL